MIKLILCVDDTDDITKKTSTGKIAEMMAKSIVKMGGEICHGITRHQLLLHEDIAYTSHNSSMCFECIIDENSISTDEVWKNISEILISEKADTSDPGLCLCRMDQVKNLNILINFGKRAQKEVLSKEEAFQLAQDVNVQLMEFGGTGLGIIGALAGTGLRLSGNDGVFRGKGKSDKIPGYYTVRECKQLLQVEDVFTKDGGILQDDEKVSIEKEVKLLYFNYKKVAMADRNEDSYKICAKSDLEETDWKQKRWDHLCKDFESDNDLEECFDEQRTCFNCLYRRWTKSGMECKK